MKTDYIYYRRYHEQQTFLHELANRLGVVCFRPEYHAQKGDANTVLFYTEEDHAHNCLVDKELTQYSRSQAADLPYHIDDKYIYRDYFWWYHNTDVNGQYNMDWANFGKLDLRQFSSWMVRLEGDVRIALAHKKQHDLIRIYGGLLGIPEADDRYNDLNRELIEAYLLRYGQCYLGNINLDPSKLQRVAHGAESLYEEYTGQKVYNFACAFCIPCESKELSDMIVCFNRKREVATLNDIEHLVYELGGEYLLWR